MIKGLIITHGDLGKELVNVVEGIIEKKSNFDLISVRWQESGTNVIKRLENYIYHNKDNKIIIFTDMFGGSPTNISLKYANGKNIEIISGINLPALLKFYSYSDKKLPFKKLVSLIKQEAVDGINILSEILGEK